MKKNISIICFILAVSFLTYCFYPVIFYNGPQINNDAGRIYIEDRQWKKGLITKNITGNFFDMEKHWSYWDLLSECSLLMEIE